MAKFNRPNVRTTVKSPVIVGVRGLVPWRGYGYGAGVAEQVCRP